MLKEKMIFWPLLSVVAGILIFSFFIQGKPDQTKNLLLQDIELAVKKMKTGKKALDKQDFDSIKAVDALDGYKLLLKRSPFFRVASEVRPEEKVELIPVKEEPKKAALKYKGKVILESKVMVIIEDGGTGKSFFVQEGDMVGDFLVLRIEEKEVALKKKGGEEMVLKLTKKEKEEKGEGLE